MPKPKTSIGKKNLISQRLIELRHQNNLSQRDLACQLQLHEYDMDKNVIIRIETNKRYVTDVNLKALSEIFHISYDYLLEEKVIASHFRYDFFPLIILPFNNT